MCFFFLNEDITVENGTGEGQIGARLQKHVFVEPFLAGGIRYIKAFKMCVLFKSLLILFTQMYK